MTAAVATLVVSGAADTILPAEDLWAVWSDLERAIVPRKRPRGRPRKTDVAA